MTSPTRDPSVQSRQTLSTRLARLTLEDIAKAIGKDDLSDVSKIRSGERRCTLVQWCALLDLCHLKLVSEHKLCVTPEEFEFMRRTTARAIANADIARTLFEDPE